MDDRGDTSGVDREQQVKAASGSVDTPPDVEPKDNAVPCEWEAPDPADSALLGPIECTTVMGRRILWRIAKGDLAPNANDREFNGKIPLDDSGHLYFSTKMPPIDENVQSHRLKRAARSEAGYSAFAVRRPAAIQKRNSLGKMPTRFTNKLEELRKLYEWYGEELDHLYASRYHTAEEGEPNEVREDDMRMGNPEAIPLQCVSLKDARHSSEHRVPIDVAHTAKHVVKEKKTRSSVPMLTDAEQGERPVTIPDPHKRVDSSESIIEVIPGDSSKVTAVHAFFVAVKAFVGTGALFLPKGFSNGGLLFSSILMAVVAYSTLHCMILLADTSAHFRGLSYGDVSKKIYGQWMKNIVMVSICLSQAGFCCAYYIFIGQNIHDFVLLLTDCKSKVNSAVYILGQLVFTIPLCLVRNLGSFSITSIIGDFIIILSISYIVGYSIWKISDEGIPENSLTLFNLQRFTHFIGAAMFSFEGIALVTPLSESMKEPRKLGRILTWCISFVLTLFVTVGIFGYLAFRKDVETNVILNLPDNSVSKIIRVAYSFAIILSFPVLLHPCTTIIEGAIFKRYNRRRDTLKIKQLKNLFRIAEVSVLALLSYLGSSHLENVVSLIGCFACIPIAFIYPAALHAKISVNKAVVIKDWAIITIGGAALVYTTYVTINSFVQGELDIPRGICNSLDN